MQLPRYDVGLCDWKRAARDLGHTRGAEPIDRLFCPYPRGNDSSLEELPFSRR
jgi:hypothetical protein